MRYKQSTVDYRTMSSVARFCRAIIARAFDGVLLLLLSVLGTISCAIPADAQVQTPDAAMAEALSLWTADREKATISVQSTFYQQGALVAVYGTAFLLSDQLAVTAAHVVCNQAAPHQPAMLIRFFFNGNQTDSLDIDPGQSGNAALQCYADNADVALIQVKAGVIGDRPYLQAGAYEDLTTDPFITIYSFSDQQPGTVRKGNALMPVDNQQRVRTDMTAGDGDSGAPVLNDQGLVVGELVGGTSTYAAVFQPLRILASKLLNLGIQLPPSGLTVIRPGSNAGPSLGGTVFVADGRLPNGNWPVPAKRPANAEEAQVVVNYTSSAGALTPVESDTTDTGQWSVPAPSLTPSDSLAFAAVVMKLSDDDLANPTNWYKSDPIFGTLTSSTDTVPQDLVLYERSAYVNHEVTLAAGEESIVHGDPSWNDCPPRSTIPTPPPSSCLQTPQLQQLISTADHYYFNAFQASAAEPNDIDITTQIAVRWAGFRLFSRRACSAAEVMQQLFDQFTNAHLTGPLLLQTLDMIVACQLTPSSSVSVMKWQQVGDTRQIASVRLIDETFAHWAQQPQVLSAQRKRVITDVLTSLESYKSGTVTVSGAAAVIARDETLRSFLKDFVSKYVVAWYGSNVTRPGSDTVSIQRSLVELRQLGS